ncbi:hypothetical protein FRC11_005730 [Ceratobasidium sp. 423]|nr:hypothetical protein FRC11_005730 [Ceratobasidium sp. 423]
MATEAFTIRSHYNISNDELSGAVQKEAVLSADVDALWESEAGPSNISLKRRIPPRFVPASNSYSPPEKGKGPEPVAATEANDIASCNRGWGMLQRHGWEEGRPLGLGSASVTPGGSISSTPIRERSATPSEADGQTQSTETTESTEAPSRTALITPLRTTLKADKRGIGPRSKSMSKPAVTHSLSDIRMAAERARRERDGRGKRGFAKTARRDAEERSRLFQELK